jgi:hypothetical protein
MPPPSLPSYGLCILSFSLKTLSKSSGCGTKFPWLQARSQQQVVRPPPFLCFFPLTDLSLIPWLPLLPFKRSLIFVLTDEYYNTISDNPNRFSVHALGF